MMTYSGPNFLTLGWEYIDTYTHEYFKKCFFQTSPIEIKSSDRWSNDTLGSKDYKKFSEND
jgi:muramoyltetrapeptide carboxypeptidase